MKPSAMLSGLSAAVIAVVMAGAPVFAQAPGAGSPLRASLDWRNYGGHSYISGVRDQGSCGAGWLFPAVGMLESGLMYNLSLPDVDLDYSEQCLLSCIAYGNGCDGGNQVDALNYLRSTARRARGASPTRRMTRCLAARAARTPRPRSSIC